MVLRNKEGRITFLSLNHGFHKRQVIQRRKKTKSRVTFFVQAGRTGTTFETTVSESSLQNVLTGILNLVLIVIALPAIFILAIAVIFFGDTKVIRTKESFLHHLPFWLS